MATIHREIHLAARPETVWNALRDVGNLHTRVCPGFVVGCRMEGEAARIVTFGNGMQVKELIVSVDDAARRVAWSAVGGRLSHHNASVQVFADAGGTRAVWIADLLPDELAGAIAGMIDEGLSAMKRTLEKSAT